VWCGERLLGHPFAGGDIDARTAEQFDGRALANMPDYILGVKLVLAELAAQVANR